MNLEKHKLAEVVYARRTAEGLTQTELSEKTGISLRSIQRIEKGEVLPRPFTVRALANVLSFSEQDLEPEQIKSMPSSNRSRAKNIILSVSIPLALSFLAFGYIAQSPTFPETDFELSVYWAIVVLIIAVFQWVVWTDKN